MTETELKKYRPKCKDCIHAQRCCGGYVLCTHYNYERRHGNTNGCLNFKRKEQNNGTH